MAMHVSSRSRDIREESIYNLIPKIEERPPKPVM